MVPEMWRETEPCGSIDGEIWCYIDAINWPLSKTVALLIGGRVLPMEIWVSMGNHFPHVQVRARKHVVKGALGHVLISINEDYQTFTGVSPSL
jgi:hypothetical protein